MRNKNVPQSEVIMRGVRDFVAVVVVCLLAWGTLFAAQKKKSRTGSRKKPSAAKTSPSKDIIQPAAKAILDRVVEKYASLQTGRFELSMDMKMQMKGMPSPPLPKTVTTTEFQRPHRMKTVMSGMMGGGSSQIVVRNANKTWVYNGMLNQYTETDAGHAMPIGDAGNFADPVGILAEGTSKRLLMNLRHAVPRPAGEKLDGRNCRIIDTRVSLNAIMPQNAPAVPPELQSMLREPIGISFFIDDDLIVRKMEIDMTNMVKAQMKSMPKSPTATPTIESIRMIFSFTRVELNPKLDEAIFVFTPPEGAKLVMSFDYGQMQRSTEGSLEGKPAPEFTLTSSDGKTVSLKDLKGKPVLLNFYAEF